MAKYDEITLGDEPPYFSTYDKYLDWLKQPAKEDKL